MNRDQGEGKWDQIKGRAKKAWGELTDDDLKKAEGSADKLYGVIQDKFGATKEAIKTKLEKLRRSKRQGSETRRALDPFG